MVSQLKSHRHKLKREHRKMVNAIESRDESKSERANCVFDSLFASFFFCSLSLNFFRRLITVTEMVHTSPKNSTQSDSSCRKHISFDVGKCYFNNTRPNDGHWLCQFDAIDNCFYIGSQTKSLIKKKAEATDVATLSSLRSTAPVTV